MWKKVKRIFISKDVFIHKVKNFPKLSSHFNSTSNWFAIKMPADLSCLCLVARARCSSSIMQLGGSGWGWAPRCGDPVGVEILPLSRDPWCSLGSVKFLGKVAGDFFTGTGGAPGEANSQILSPGDMSVITALSSPSHHLSCPVEWAVSQEDLVEEGCWLVSEALLPPFPVSPRRPWPLRSSAPHRGHLLTCSHLLCLHPHSDPFLQPPSDLQPNLELKSSNNKNKVWLDFEVSVSS